MTMSAPFFYLEIKSHYDKKNAMIKYVQQKSERPHGRTETRHTRGRCSYN